MIGAKAMHAGTDYTPQGALMTSDGFLFLQVNDSEFSDGDFEVTAAELIAQGMGFEYTGDIANDKPEWQEHADKVRARITEIEVKK